VAQKTEWINVEPPVPQACVHLQMTYIDRFCPQCGAEKVLCGGCSTHIRPGANFCTNCGRRRGK
jgi:predicted amidophosphoribosyltransferase